MQTDIEKFFEGEKDKAIWEGVKRKYWVLNTYNLPIVKHMDILDCCEPEPATDKKEGEEAGEEDGADSKKPKLN